MAKIYDKKVIIYNLYSFILYLYELINIFKVDRIDIIWILSSGRKSFYDTKV